MSIVGAILAGGLARRLGGGDKCLLPVAGRPILAHVVERLRPQCAHLLLNANDDPGRFSSFGLTVVPDTLPGRLGPLAGLLAILDHLAEHHGAVTDVLTVPGDAPFLPGDLASRLAEARRTAGARIACAASGGRRHPVVALWPVAIRAELAHALRDGERSVGSFASRHMLASVEWPDPDPFLNVNTPEDLAAAAQRDR